MNIELRTTTEIKPYPNNAKKHDDVQIEAVAKSIQRFGFVQPIVIDKFNEIIIGHCRFLAAQKLGLQEVPIVRLENLTDEEVKTLRLADNKLNESDWDMELVKYDLGSLSPQMIELTGFDVNDLTDEPQKLDFHNMFQVVIDANNEEECRKIFEELQSQGYNVKIVTI